MEEKNNFWKTPRGKAIIKLSLWLIFFIIVIIVATFDTGNITNNNKNNTEEKEPIRFDLYSDMLDKLLKNNYAYEYSIKVGDKSFIYTGESDGEITLGLKESDEGVIKYCINKDGIYKKVLDNLEPIDNLYENEEKSFDLNSLFSSIKGKNYKVEKEDETREIIYDLSEETLIVKTNLKEITNINYIKNNEEYNLTFSKIGEIEKLSVN